MPRYLAMGLIETRGLIAAIEAADAAAKTAEIHLVRKERVDGGLVSVRFIGETSAVQEATRAGAERAGRVGQLISVHVIPRLDEMTARMLGVPLDDEEPSPSVAPPSPSVDYDAMATTELRTLARNTPGFPYKGRELNRMTKAELVEAFRKFSADGGRE